MRNIMIARGAQGAGKTRLIHLLGLQGHHLSFDKVREVISGDTVAISGEMGIPQQHNQLVRAVTFESLERRMREGETIAFEATLPGVKEVMAIVDLAREHRYEVLLADFFDIPVECAVARNALRPERVRVPEFAVRRCYQDVANDARMNSLPEDLRVVRISDPEALDQPIAEIRAFLQRQTQIRDASSYDRIVHVGDLQGTFDPIEDPASPLAGGLRDDTLYIFCGDLFDRGVQNDKVARWWLDHVHGRHNVVAVAGNHEDHVEIQAAGREAVSREWRDRTWPQLEAIGLTDADMATIASGFVPLFMYDWRGTRVLVTHGGLTRWPSEPHLIPEIILRKGNGHYGHGIDAMWVEAEKESGLVQVHGHRNSRSLPVLAARAHDGPDAAMSFNLEGQCEFGGHMRFAVLDTEGWHTIQIRPREFRTMQQEAAISRARGRKTFEDQAPITPWIARGDEDLVPLSAETKAAFQDHAMIGETVSETMPNVSSWNFTKSAFYTQNWDRYTSVARGLFVDNIDDTIVSRGMDKFYNLGERPETTLEALEKSIRWPVQIFDKANGFFATIGYSERAGDIVITSKSRVEGTFPDMARAVMLDKLGAGGLERVLRFNRDQKACLMFEVVDMAGDPHIIDYPENKLVLLACIRRHERFEQVDYETLQAIAKWIGCEVKQKQFGDVKDWRALAGIMHRIENDENWRRENPTEGAVIEDASGFHWKVKGAFYARWKRMRGAVERIALTRRKDATIDRERYAQMPAQYQEFLNWAEQLPTEALGVGIIRLRNMYFGDRSAAEGMGAKPVPKAKDMSGYVKALEAMAANVEAGRAKPETVRRMVEAAMAHDDRRMVFESSAAGDVLRAFMLQAA
jgi:predicted kinase